MILLVALTLTVNIRCKNLSACAILVPVEIRIMVVVCNKNLIAPLLCVARMHIVMLDRMLLNVCVRLDTLEIRIFSVMVRIIEAKSHCPSLNFGRKFKNFIVTKKDINPFLNRLYPFVKVFKENSRIIQ